MNKPKLNVIIRSKGEWLAISIAALNESFEHLRQSREILVNSKQLDPIWDNHYKQAGQWMLNLLKEFQKINKKPKTTEEVLNEPK